MILRSPSFPHGGPIPATFTADGRGDSPCLRWGDVPAAAAAFALIVTDPDVPDPRNPQRTWVHWVLWDLPAACRALRQGAGGRPLDLPAGTRQGANDWGRTGWGPPDPPMGVHRYVFSLYALDACLGSLGATPLPGAGAVRGAIAARGGELARAELIGVYGRTA